MGKQTANTVAGAMAVIRYRDSTARSDLGSHTGDRENPFGSAHFKVRVSDWDLIRAEH
jgi:hypothetical protein